MKNLVVFMLAILAAVATYAQDAAEEETTSNWAKSASFGLNVTNVGLENWAGGGQSSLAIAGLVKAGAVYTKGAVTWDNSLEAGYGLLRQRDDANVIQLRKSDDRFILASKFSKDFGESPWAFTGLLDFRTQMTDGFEYSYDENNVLQENRISRLFAPGYLTVAVGGEYKPNDNFYAMLSPVSGKLTFVMDETLSNQGAFGVDTGQTVRAELGATFNMRWGWNIAENIDFETKLNLFQAYRSGAFVDVMWDNLIEMKVNDYISTTFSTQLIYDEDVLIFSADDGLEKDRIQFKHVLNVGFLFKI